MMLLWRSQPVRSRSPSSGGGCWLALLYVAMLLTETVVKCNILQAVLGLPTECRHHNRVRPCKLSFSCWLQGGKHVQGCGDNRWLFSCCITDKESRMPMPPASATTGTGTSGNVPTAGALDSTVAAAASAPIPAAIVYVAASHAPAQIKGIVLRKPPATTQKLIARPARHKGSVAKRPAKFNAGTNKFPAKKNILRRRTDDGAASAAAQHKSQATALQPVECGVARTAQNTIQKRIIGGRTAAFAEYPWQAHIRIAEFQCGGVLVARQFIATAAHCIQQARVKDIVVYLGELDTQNVSAAMEPLPAEKHRVIKKLVHPRFQFRVTQPDRYDLALLQLATPTAYKNHILPICLPTARLEIVGRKGVIAGWGKTQANMGHTGTNVLQSAAVPIISTDDCIKWHESKQINVELFDEMFCAGHPDGHQDACLGDSGGPLIVRDPRGRFTLVGITSAGFGCGIDHQPGIYHNVQLTARWIQDVIQKALS